MKRFALLVTSWIVVGCAFGRAAGPSAPPIAVDVTEPEPPVTVAAPTAEPAPMLSPTLPEESAPATLPRSWTMTFDQNRPYAQALAIARAAKTTFEGAARAITPNVDGGTPDPKQFERATSLLEIANRRYAGVYHAPDSTPANKVETLSEAASMLFGWSRKLDEAGLARAPAPYKTDPSIALTFEDIANGPAKRWREEGIALVQLCVESAKRERIDSKAAKECVAHRTLYTHALPRRSSDAGAASAATGCACPHGDPMCSSSMSGWCHPK